MCRGKIKLSFLSKGIMLTIIFAVMLQFETSDALATYYYIRKSATGSNNGTSWANAWNEMSQVNSNGLSAGDTVFIAGGNYSKSLTISKGGSSDTNRIVFKRATVSEHGSDTGWNSNYDSKVSIIDNNSANVISINAPYVTIDGVTRYGIYLRGGIYFTVNGSVYTTYRYIEFDGTGDVSEDSMLNDSGDNNFLMEYCYLHDYDNAVRHGDTWSSYGGSNCTLRYNVFVNGGQYISMDRMGPNLNIYGNLFYNTAGSNGYNGIVANSVSAPVNIYNNTFDSGSASNNGYHQVIYVVNGNYSGINFKNNAIRRANAGGIGSCGSHNNNAYESGTTWNYPSENGRVVSNNLGFVNTSNYDYHIQSSSPLINGGTSVNLPHDFDKVSISSAPDIGAYEYKSSASTSAASSSSPSPPTQLRVLSN